jgi:GT2 family glycosyltransferase
MLLKRDVYERIGGLDERFSPGPYEDDDYCLRARMHGYGLFLCRNVLVRRPGSASFERTDSGELERLRERNKRLFIDKWQIDPEIFGGIGESFVES